jgi:hypothetical protein
MLSEHARSWRPSRVFVSEYRAEGVMLITAPTGAAPHSSGCICAGPDYSLTWDRAASGCPDIPPNTVAIVCAKAI